MIGFCALGVLAIYYFNYLAYEVGWVVFCPILFFIDGLWMAILFSYFGEILNILIGNGTDGTLVFIKDCLKGWGRGGKGGLFLNGTKLFVGAGLTILDLD